MRKLRVCQVTPGLIEIPPKNWGAIEKVIWNYKINLEKMGHEVDIQLPWHVKEKDGVFYNYDIIHVHTANQCLIDMVQQQKVPYIFAMHDHHVVRHGKDSGKFKENLEAIKNSIISFTFGEFLIDYFVETDKLFYIPHGVDNETYKFQNKRHTDHKLLCVANNGYADDQSYDRKGFRYSIEAAKKLDLPITIVGPKNNDNFFNQNKDLLEYKKLEIIYAPDEKELVDIYNDHTIFLHPSELEAGHPNLTLLEALACGLPIVGTYDGKSELKGLIKAGRDTNDVYEKLKTVIKDYTKHKVNALDTAKKYDWSNIVKILENSYQNVVDIKEEYTHEKFRNKLVTIYKKSEIKKIPPKEPKVIYNYHFNEGCFFEILSNKKSSFNVKFIDDDNGQVIDNFNLTNNMWARSYIKYYKNWKINVTDSNGNTKEFKMELKDKNVFVRIDSKSLGDSIAWFPYMVEFAEKHQCKMFASTYHNFLFEKKYPNINFVNPGEKPKDNGEDAVIYASYVIGWFSPPWGGPKDWNPNDYRTIPMQQTSSDILGLPYKEIMPKIDVDEGERPIPEKYVCLSEHSTAQAKYWNNRGGWQKIIDHLNSIGYKVMVISKEGTTLKNIVNETGNKSLQIRANQIKHCEFFIGIGSGLSWLAWSLEKKVVMISGFSKPFCEFTSNNIRIHKKDVCNGCFNNKNYDFDRGDWNWCPIWKGTNRMFECSKLITPEYVIEEMEKYDLVIKK